MGLGQCCVRSANGLAGLLIVYVWAIEMSPWGSEVSFTAQAFQALHGISAATNPTRVICACSNTGMFVGSVLPEPEAMPDVWSWSALVLQTRGYILMLSSQSICIHG